MRKFTGSAETIYLDYQASTPVAAEVLERMLPYFTQEYANPHSSEHSMGWTASAAIEQSRQQVAQLVGADEDEVIFTSGATEANNLALFGLARANKDLTRRRILIGATEHKSVLAVAQAIQNQLGYEITMLPVTNEGFINLDAYKQALGDDVLCVSIMAVNNEIGTIQDISSLAAIATEYGAIFHCDAAQAPLGTEASSLANHADLISLSAHKMYGPKGIGALIIRRDLQDKIEPMMYGGEQQNGVRAGTLPTALCVGMGHASHLASANYAAHSRHMANLSNLFLQELKNYQIDFDLNGPASQAQRHPGNLNLSFEGNSASDLVNKLQPNIAVSTGSACSSGTIEKSYVLHEIGLDDARTNGAIRISIGVDTTKEQVLKSAKLFARAAHCN